MNGPTSSTAKLKQVHEGCCTVSAIPYIQSKTWRLCIMLPVKSLTLQTRTGIILYLNCLFAWFTMLWLICNESNCQSCYGIWMHITQSFCSKNNHPIHIWAFRYLNMLTFFNVEWILHWIKHCVHLALDQFEWQSIFTPDIAFLDNRGLAVIPAWKSDHMPCKNAGCNYLSIPAP